MILDTELIRYKWQGVNANYPDYEKLIPTEFNTFAHFDTVEAIKATNSLKALSEKPKDYPIDLTIGNGKIVMANPDEKGQADIVADTDGQGKVRLDGQYLTQALRACGGMVDFKLTNPYSPTLFTTNDYQLVVMPMMTNEASDAQKRDAEAKQAEPVSEPVAEPTDEVTEPEPTEPEAEPVAEKPKAKRSRAKEPVTA